MSNLRTGWFLATLLFVQLIAINVLNASKITDSTQTKSHLEHLQMQLSSTSKKNEAAEQLLKQQQEAWQIHRASISLKTINQQDCEQTTLALALAKTELLRLDDQISEFQQRIKKNQLELNRLQAQLTDLKLSSGFDQPDAQQLISILDEDIELMQKIATLQKQVLTALSQSKVIQRGSVELYTEKRATLNRLLLSRQQWEKKNKLNSIHVAALQEQDAYNRQLIDLQLEQYENIEAHGVHSGEAVSIQLAIYRLSELIKLSQLNAALLMLELEIAATETNDRIVTNNLSNRYEQVLKANNQLQSIQRQLAEKVKLMRDYDSIITKSYHQNIINQSQQQNLIVKFDTISKQYNEQLEQASNLQMRLNELQKSMQVKLAEELAKRPKLPGFDLSLWRDLFQQFLAIPTKVINYIVALVDTVFVALKAMSTYQVGGLITAEIFIIFMWFIVRSYSESLVRVIGEKRNIVSANIIYFVTSILKRNLFALGLFSVLITLFYFCNIPFRYYDTLFYLFLVWFIFRFIIGVTRVALVERLSNAQGQDVKLYYRLRRTFIVGGLITALMMLLNQLDFHSQIHELAIRLFMLFLLTVSLVLLWGHRVVPDLAEPYLVGKRPYLLKSIRLLSVLIPLAVLLVAIAGLLGYIKLAQSMSYYQLIFVFVVACYTIARGVIVDIMNVSAHYIIMHSKNGWLWSEAILKPIDKVLRVLIFFTAIFLLFYLTGFHKDPDLLDSMDSVLNYSIFAFTGGDITLLSSMQFIILVAILIWAAKWGREFAYRWLFSDIRDSSLRNNFSLFLQYGFITIGAFITLRVLGIDLTGMAVILGGLAVGLGFGLRDLISNLVSGLIILIERPVREGDLVSISDYEGEVTRIGLRTMNIRSWDNMEVIIPNAEVFNKSFTNWTSQDSIVRTVVPVKIQRQDNPEAVQKIIVETLELIPEILKEPPISVYLKHIDESLVEFEVRYFINLSESSRVAIRSQVLFHIYDAFERCGIKAPIAEQSLHIKSLPKNNEIIK